MRTIYEVDTNRIYTGQVKQITEKEGKSRLWIETELVPPTGVAQWVGNEWLTLPEYPVDINSTIEALKQQKWEDIKNYRNTLTQTGGYKASNKWFHSDTFSRSQQLGLIIMGANIPQGLMWKTMDGTFIEMTPTLAQEVFNAAAAQDNAIFTHAEILNAQVQVLPTVEEVQSFDITQGWPETYQP